MAFRGEADAAGDAPRSTRRATTPSGSCLICGAPFADYRPWAEDRPSSYLNLPDRRGRGLAGVPDAQERSKLLRGGTHVRRRFIGAGRVPHFSPGGLGQANGEIRCLP